MTKGGIRTRRRNVLNWPVLPITVAPITAESINRIEVVHLGEIESIAGELTEMHIDENKKFQVIVTPEGGNEMAADVASPFDIIHIGCIFGFWARLKVLSGVEVAVVVCINDMEEESLEEG